MKFITAVCETMSWAGYDYPDPKDVHHRYVGIELEEEGAMNGDVWHVAVLKVHLSAGDDNWVIVYDADSLNNLTRIADGVRSGHVRKTRVPFWVWPESVTLNNKLVSNPMG